MRNFLVTCPVCEYNFIWVVSETVIATAREEYWGYLEKAEEARETYDWGKMDGMYALSDNCGGGLRREACPSCLVELRLYFDFFDTDGTPTARCEIWELSKRHLSNTQEVTLTGIHRSLIRVGQHE